MLLWACADGEEGKALLTRASSVSDDYLQFLSRPHHIEKRFLVDRKKLEKLITGGCGRVEKAWQREVEVYLHVEWAERGCVFLDIVSAHCQKGLQSMVHNILYASRRYQKSLFFQSALS